MSAGREVRVGFVGIAAVEFAFGSRLNACLLNATNVRVALSWLVKSKEIAVKMGVGKLKQKLQLTLCLTPILWWFIDIFTNFTKRERESFVISICKNCEIEHNQN